MGAMRRRNPGPRAHDRTADAVSGIGDILRRRRLTLGLSLDEVHERIRVPVRFLEAIESDHFDTFGVAQYAKGFVRSYAQFLGLDPDPFVARILVAPPREARSKLVAAGEVPIRPTAPRSPLRRALVWATVVFGAVVLAVGYIGYRQIRQFYQSSAAPSTADVTPGLDSPAAPTAAPAPGPGLPPQNVAADSGVRIALQADEVSWVSVTADGARVFDGFLRSGERRAWEAATSLGVTIGNAAAVRVHFNGRDLGLLGGEGEVVRRTFTRGQPAQERNP
jgi:transcriptional regulator with XRE-family HTH domain